MVCPRAAKSACTFFLLYLYSNLTIPPLFSTKTCTARLMTFDWTYSPHPEKEGEAEGHFHWCPSRWKERCRIYTDGVINWLRPTGFAVLLDLASSRVYDLNDFLLSAWSSQPRRNIKRLIIVHNDVRRRSTIMLFCYCLTVLMIYIWVSISTFT